MIFIKNRNALLIFILLFFSSAESYALFGGVKTAAKTVENSLNRTMLQALVIRDKTDEDIRDYLKKINHMREETLQALASNSSEIINKLVNESRALEESIYKKSVDLVWRAQCSATVVTDDVVPRALAKSFNMIAESEACLLKTFDWCPVSASIEPIKHEDIKHPDNVYDEIKTYELAKLDYFFDQHGEDMNSQIVISTYANLARLAKLVQCHYLEQDYQKIFIEDYFEFERLNKPWIKIRRKR